MLIAKRARTPEIMDGSDFTPAELSKNLADIWLYHRLTGGISALLRAIEPLTHGLAPAVRLSALDVGAGSADVASRVASWLDRRGFSEWPPREVAAPGASIAARPTPGRCRTATPRSTSPTRA